MSGKSIGIIYLMKSVINGVYKIGISNVDSFENRMYNLEKNGYDNIGGLKRVIAIKTENYEVKEKMLHDIFSKSRIAQTEFFAVDKNLVEQLFYSLKGEIIFPKKVDVEEEIEEIAERQEEEIGRREFIEFVKFNHKRKPDILRNLLKGRNEYNIRGNKVKLYTNHKTDNSGMNLTYELEDRLFFYVNYSRKDSAKAKKDFEKVFGEPNE